MSIDKNNLPTGFLRAIHRPPALRVPEYPLPSERFAREAYAGPGRPLEGVLTAKATNLPNDNPEPELPHPKSERHKAPTLGAAGKGKEESLPRTRIRFTGYRVRPLDPDNFAGSCKDLLDGCRHAGLIPGDEPWRIILETEQVRVRSFKEEKTVIEIGEPEGV